METDDVPWLKVSDKFATHPLVLAIGRTFRSDDRSINEVVGFLTRCASSSASYMTDYQITFPEAQVYGGARTELLLRQAVEAGLCTAQGRGKARTWLIVEDDDLFHIRAREDVEWERQRDRDRRNVDLVMPVVARDGDQCRYCRNVVIVKDTRSGRGRSFDHTEPGKPARIETYVVCCQRCNSRLKDRRRPVPDLPLLVAPPLPYFSPKSSAKDDVEAYYGHSIRSANQPFVDTANPPPRPVTQTDTARPARPAHQVDTAHPSRPSSGSRDTAPSATPEVEDTALSATLDHAGDTALSATSRNPTGPAPPGPRVQHPWSEGGRRVGSGRAGTGAPPPDWALPSDASATPPLDPSRSSRRARRGKADS